MGTICEPELEHNNEPMGSQSLVKSLNTFTDISDSQYNFLFTNGMVSLYLF